jgi:3-hydroxybutyryl-CoA dehydrogenase
VTNDIKRAVVIGAGAMGSGIALVFARSGVEVTLVDIDETGLHRAVSSIAEQLDRSVAKGRMDAAESSATKKRIITSTFLEGTASHADLALEAIFENVDAKQELFRKLDASLPEHAIIATNTSSISVTRLAATVKDPGRVAGMHFFNPAPVMPLVEVVRALQSAPETIDQIAKLAIACGKTPIESSDSPGFVGNRILLPMINEAIFCLSEQVADRDSIDRVMQLGMSHPMGPLALADLIGLDVCLSVLDVLHQEFGDDKYRPAPRLRTMVAAGRLGKKSGRGFYDYSTGETPG